MTLDLLNKIDISAAGKNCKLLLGDVDGDGRMEIICAQPDGGIDDRYIPHMVTCVTVFDLNGKMLWQKGTPVEEPGGPGSDYPCQAADVDGDGRLEVLVIMNKILYILEGATGEIKRKFPLSKLPRLEVAHPLSADDGKSPNAYDCIIIANLTGNKEPRDIILKDRYKNMWALDGDFNLLWTHSGNVGHFPLAVDINDDGFDEIMAGYDLLDHNGRLLWSCRDLDDHADCLWAGDVNGDGRLEICVGGSVTCLYDREGNELWRYDGSIESQHVALGKFDESAKGLQIAGLDRIQRGDGHKGQWDGKDGMFLLSSEGREIWKEDRQTKGWLTIVNTLRNWGGEHKDYILAYRRGGGVNPTLYNGKMEKVVTFPEDGYVIYGDLFGRDCTDVIIYREETAFVYSARPIDVNTVTHKQVSQDARLIRSTLYPGCIYE